MGEIGDPALISTSKECSLGQTLASKGSAPETERITARCRPVNCGPWQEFHVNAKLADWSSVGAVWSEDAVLSVRSVSRGDGKKRSE